jgi:hypothetical protein
MPKPKKMNGREQSVNGRPIYPPRNRLDRNHWLTTAEYWTPREVVAAIRAAGGVMTHAAKILVKTTKRGSPDPNVIKKYIDRYDECAQALLEAREENLDVAESSLLKLIKNDQHSNHLRAVTFYLRYQGKQRGYSVRQEITGKDGGPVQLQSLQLDYSKYSDDELERLERLHEELTKLYEKAIVDGRAMNDEGLPKLPAPVTDAQYEILE